MEDLDVNENEIKAFNEGYLIGKHRPEILNGVINQNPDNEYAQLLGKGKRQADKENLIKHQQETKQKTVVKSPSRGR